MMDDFYSIFEKNFRGTQAEVLERLAVYDPFLDALLQIDPHALALDLGCGRGEWLEKLQGMGFSVHGVDLDESMLSGCRDKGFTVTCQDALAYLSNLPDDSQTIVTAFHVIEHITIEQLRALLTEALRVLKPAGLLILETPNPENLVVATRNFYLDPTHLRPIPPELLTFLARHAGHGCVKLLRLQENPSIIQQSQVMLTDVIHGVSPDYAVVAQKPGPQALAERLAPAFEPDRGIGLQTLVSRFDEFSRSQNAAIHQELQALSFFLVNEIQTLQKNQNDLLAWRQKTIKWKLSRVFVWFRMQRQLVATHGLRVRSKALLRKIALKCKGLIEKNPKLRQFVVTVVRRFGLVPLLKRIIYRPVDQRLGNSAGLPKTAVHRNELPASALAKKIKSELKKRITQQGKQSCE